MAMRDAGNFFLIPYGGSTKIRLTEPFGINLILESLLNRQGTRKLHFTLTFSASPTIYTIANRY